MSALEQSIRDICARHNLHSFSVGLLIPNDMHGAGWNVSLQRWVDNERSVGCWQASGTSIATALAAAIAEIPVASALADEALPDIRGKGWTADCPKCVASKFTCDEHFASELTA
jgi:hypothetical protein